MSALNAGMRMNKGKIVQVIGPVVDAEFPDELPAIYNALTVEFQVPGQEEPITLILEVQQHLGDNWVRAVAMSTTEGLKRGAEIIDTGQPITVPVGEAVMGRVLDVTGSPVDERGPVETEQRGPIHRPAPALVDRSASRASSGQRTSWSCSSAAPTTPWPASSSSTWAAWAWATTGPAR
jgi:F-type H+-transporting ATPase subunit beta